MYDPSVGRWLEEDPEDFAAGDMNLYRYVGNKLTIRTDPSGTRGLVLGYFTFKLPDDGIQKAVPSPDNMINGTLIVNKNVIGTHLTSIEPNTKPVPIPVNAEKTGGVLIRFVGKGFQDVRFIQYHRLYAQITLSRPKLNEDPNGMICDFRNVVPQGPYGSKEHRHRVSGPGNPQFEWDGPENHEKNVPDSPYYFDTGRKANGLGGIDESEKTSFVFDEPTFVIGVASGPLKDDAIRAQNREIINGTGYRVSGWEASMLFDTFAVSKSKGTVLGHVLWKYKVSTFLERLGDFSSVSKLSVGIQAHVDVARPNQSILNEMNAHFGGSFMH